MEDEDVKEAVKLNTMILLHEKYGITEKEFMRAEIEITPLTSAVTSVLTAPWWAATVTMTVWTAYPALMAEIETQGPGLHHRLRPHR